MDDGDVINEIACSYCGAKIGERCTWPNGNHPTFSHSRRKKEYEKMQIYIYSWGNNSKRIEMKGRRCQVVKQMRMNSVLIQFLDTGQQEIVSWHSLRKESAGG